jgi:hypothetical protein
MTLFRNMILRFYGKANPVKKSTLQTKKAPQKQKLLSKKRFEKNDLVRKPHPSISINEENFPIIPIKDLKTENRFYLKDLKSDDKSLDPFFVSKIWTSYQRQKFNNSTKRDHEYAKSRGNSIKFLGKLSSKLGFLSVIPDYSIAPLNRRMASLTPPTRLPFNY